MRPQNRRALITPSVSDMKTVQTLSCLAAIAWLVSCAGAQAQSRAQYEAMVAAEAQANLVPEELVHRVIVRESKYQPHLIGRGGAIGMMQMAWKQYGVGGMFECMDALRSSLAKAKGGVS